MSTKYVQDMTEGNIVSHLIKFSAPMLIGNVFQQFYNLINSIVVGRFIDANALAAVGVTSSICFFFFAVALGVSVGIGIVISQYFGAREDEQVKRAIANSIYIVGAVAILLSILAIACARPILILLQTPQEIIDDATTFLRIISGGTIAVAAYNAIASILRALGDSKTPLYFLIGSCIMNALLDLLFVLGFGFGVSGTAWATVISQGTAALCCILYAIRKNPYFHLKAQHLKISKPIILKCIRIGLPVAAQNALIAFSLVALQRVVNSFGPTAVAAYTGISRIEQLIQQPYGSLGAAMATFSGQNMGANKLDRVKEGYRKSILIVAVFSFLALLAAQFGGRAIMQIFVEKPEVIDLGAVGIKITSSMYFALGMIYITRGLLNGAGDATYAMVNGLIEVIGRVGFSTLLVMIPVFDVWSLWATTGLTWFITAAASVIRYKQGIWKRKAIVKQS